MGNCESTANTQSKPGSVQRIVQSMKHEPIENHQVNMPKTNLRHIECEIDPLKSYTEFDHDTKKELSKEICKIVIETEKGRKTGTGFILAILFELDSFYCLMTNDHIISDESINNNSIIYITYEEYKTACIKLDRNKRYIKSFKDKELDITVVEILDEDNISKDYYLEPELDIPLNNKLINKEIYIPQYIEGLKLKNAEGKIKDIFDYEFSHLANTQEGSSGSPIFLKIVKKL